MVFPMKLEFQQVFICTLFITSCRSTDYSMLPIKNILHFPITKRVVVTK